jgi:shikimate dehydrogenase
MGISIDGKTRLAGVMGNPIAHTLSPAMHNAAFSALGINAVYVALPIPAEGVKGLLQTCTDLGMLGLNITIPHKRLAMKYVHECSADARRIGAINTVVFQGKKRIGHNTDGLGFLQALKAAKISLRGKRAVLLGAGGAGRAVAVSLLQAGVTHLTLSEPNAKQRSGLLRQLKILGYNNRVIGVEPNAPVLRERALAAHVIVNASPLGLKPGDPLPISGEWIPEKQAVMDLVYGHGLTPWLQAARKKQCRIVPGWHMLLYQGAEAFRLWTGCKPPVEIMRRALLRSGVEGK